MSNSIVTENHIRKILEYVGINLPTDPDGNGQILMSSPLREDKNPSFSMNLKENGVWIDHATGEKGNIIHLISKYLKIENDIALKLAVEILRGNYPNILNYRIPKKRQYHSKTESSKKTGITDSCKNFSQQADINTENISNGSIGQKPIYNSRQATDRLNNEKNSLLECVEKYDLLTKETLLAYNCGIRFEYNSDWLSIPYETGVQLYRRVNEKKVIRMLKGSKPTGSFFGTENLSGKSVLFIAKSPREAMLLHQEFGEYVDVISIMSGEVCKLSDLQEKKLKTVIKSYKIIKVIFDCDTKAAHQTAKEFTRSVVTAVQSRCLLKYINISKLTDQECKDLNDLLKTGKNRDWIIEIILSKGVSFKGKRRVKPSDLAGKELMVEEAPPHPEEVYEVLPSSLKKMMDLLDKRYKKDVFLNSALPVIAGHMPNVQIHHSDGVYSPDFFNILIAEPGSGKGIADKARKLGNTANAHLLHISKEEKAKWEQLPKEAREFKPKPKIRQLFIPGNSSARAIYESLDCNMGRGLIFETEIDSLVNASQQEWGDYTDIVRKTFHHESISLNRKDFELSIQRPELSIFMSGTFDQFRTMFPSAENGYFSRFAFYTFSAPIEWQSHRPSKESDLLEKIIQSTSDKLFHIYRYLNERPNPLSVRLEDHHWDQLDDDFEQNMKRLKEEKMSRYLQSSNKRLALVAIRIATIVAVFRSYENSKDDVLKSDVLIITDDDFKVGHLLANNHFNHTIRLYQLLPNVKCNGKPGKIRDLFYSMLPDRFEKKEANFAGLELNITKRSVTNYINRLVDAGLLSKERHGVYQKQK